MAIYEQCGKRFLDVAISAIALPPMAFVSLAVALVVKLDDGGPVLFRGQRRGRGGLPFTMYKFRTMKVDSPDVRNADGSTFSGARDPRVTRIGKLLRKTSVDEIPQLINVLRGDMSLVGPRPDMATRGASELNDLELKRLEVRPGITGLTQSLYRNSVTAEKKYQTDAYYVDNMSFRLDAGIILRTLVNVLGSKNVFTPASVHEEGSGRP